VAQTWNEGGVAVAAHLATHTIAFKDEALQGGAAVFLDQIELKRGLEALIDPRGEQQRGGALAFEMGDAQRFEFREVLPRGGVLEATGERGAHEVRARPGEVAHVEVGGFGAHGGQQGVELPCGIAPAAAVDDECVDAASKSALRNAV
jgi:hypothetical protein